MITESNSHYHHLEKMATKEILRNINKEDQSVPTAVAKVIPAIEKLVDAIVNKLKKGGRLFYLGSGTSGRLGILDASECPPTFGVSNDLVIGLIAGGDGAIRNAVEHAEDDMTRAWETLKTYAISSNDIVIGISASGRTPYVLGALEDCKRNGVATACIVCNPATQIAKIADFPVAVITGPEFVTASTRMKAGTAQKLVLNMISTAVMIKLGKILDNKMIDMKLSNDKLKARATQMLMTWLKCSKGEAEIALEKHGSIRAALEAVQS